MSTAPLVIFHQSFLITVDFIPFILKLCRVFFGSLKMKMWFNVALLSVSSTYLIPWADPENFARGGPTLTRVFLADEGCEDPNATISGPSSARKRNPI